MYISKITKEKETFSKQESFVFFFENFPKKQKEKMKMKIQKKKKKLWKLHMCCGATILNYSCIFYFSVFLLT